MEVIMSFLRYFFKVQPFPCFRRRSSTATSCDEWTTSTSTMTTGREATTPSTTTKRLTGQFKTAPDSSEEPLLNGKYYCTVELLFDLFGLACFVNKNKNCQLSYSWFQTSQTGGQWHVILPPLVFPALSCLMFGSKASLCPKSWGTLKYFNSF